MTREEAQGELGAALARATRKLEEAAREKGRTADAILATFETVSDELDLELIARGFDRRVRRIVDTFLVEAAAKALGAPGASSVDLHAAALTEALEHAVRART